MKTVTQSAIFSLFWIAISMAYGGLPTMNVSVSDASGKAVLQGATTSTGDFATEKLKPGEYQVLLKAKSGAVKGNHYAIVVSAGKKKVAASEVPGEILTGAGVEFSVEVGAGLNITVEVSQELRTAMIDGKKMVYLPAMPHSTLPSGWVEADSAEAKAYKYLVRHGPR